MKVIFLDIDGVLNCQTFYEQVHQRTILETQAAQGDADAQEKAYRRGQLCPDRIKMLNGLCEETGAVVVISSTWRGSGIQYCRSALQEAGATFEIIDVTPWLRHEACVRGNEIRHWIEQNSVKLFGISASDFISYAIIDDDSDMLLWQAPHFFQTDCYSGLTPNICYRIKRFFEGKYLK